jgi:cbb3-type cytochrome oxidase cytochrome c subunit
MDTDKSVDEPGNLLNVTEAIENLPDSAFQEQLKNCEYHSLIDEGELKKMKVMIAYIYEVGQALEERFSDEDFYADDCSFTEPLKRKYNKCNIN